MNKLSISIVTYNNEDTIYDALFSIYTSDMAAQVIVVDNNSSDNTVAIIKDNFPQINLVCLKKNTGFGAAHNQAIKLIHSDYHIVMNPDIRFEKNVLSNVIYYMDKYRDIVLMSPKVLNVDSTIQHLPKRKPLFKYIISGLLEKKSNNFYKLRSEYTLRERDITNILDIEFCTGCFMIMRTMIFKECQGFDERFFLYFEDTDLTYRFSIYGRTVYNPYIQVYHYWNRDNHKKLKASLIMIHSYVKLKAKWFLKTERRITS